MNPLTARDPEVVAAARVARAIRTGAPSAVRDAMECCADDVVLTCRNGTFTGRAEVARRLSGDWPLLPVLARGVWSPPFPDGKWQVVSARFPGLGASPADYSLRIRCRDGLVAEVVESYAPMPNISGTSIPDEIVAVINRALHEGRPLVLAYVDDSGHPALSLRGSFQIAADCTAWMWSRKSDGGLVEALATRPDLSFLYRDSATRTTLRLRGVGRVVTDDDGRAAIFRSTPEVEQLHDPDMSGAAIAVHITSVVGTSPFGSVDIGG